MKNTAWVFPGQGSQKPGMGRALYDRFPAARAVFDEVDDALGERLSQTIFDGDEDTLKQTEVAQPAIMTVSMAVVRALESHAGITPDMAGCVAGHSLGEYSALCAAGSLTLADTARLLRLRGQAMQRAVPAGLGAMAALMGADMAMASDIAAQAAQGEVCAAANDNADGQIVLSGHAAAVDRALALAAERGLKRSVKLPVSAPFHCALMQPAADAMRDALAHVDLRDPCVPLYANVTAAPVQSAAEIRDLLVRQVTGTVRWRESVLAMKAAGIERLLECGHGNVLAGLAKRIDKSIEVVGAGDPDAWPDFLQK